MSKRSIRKRRHQLVHYEYAAATMTIATRDSERVEIPVRDARVEERRERR